MSGCGFPVLGPGKLFFFSGSARIEWWLSALVCNVAQYVYTVGVNYKMLVSSYLNIILAFSKRSNG